MTLEGLLAIAGIIVAVYAMAQPVQRRSIGLFVPIWLVPSSLVLSAGLVLWKEVADVFGYYLLPWADCLVIVMAFLSPVITTIVAIILWDRARLSPRKDAGFREFIRACLRESRFDELVRIMEKNYNRCARAYQRETADLLFDDRLVQAMVQAKTWIHLELLVNEDFYKLLQFPRGAVGRTLRALLSSDNSPLRTAALIDEGGDETLHYNDPEDRLIKTFRDPTWYHRCEAGYPLLIAACEKIDSGELDNSYNQVASRYGAWQGVSTRTYCPIFLAEKTIAHVLIASIESGGVTPQQSHRNAADLWDLFKTIYKHSQYKPETWDEPIECGDYPTPFGFLLAGILNDYEDACDKALSQSHYGTTPPKEALNSVIRMWAYCIMYFIER